MRSNFMMRKLHSKKGITLVETVCAIMILAIVCVGVLNAVAFSREMVYTNNSREKASDKAQLIADEIVTAAAGVDPSASDGVTIIQSKVNSIANNAAATDVQNSEIGNVKNVLNFADPTSDDEMIQYILTPVTDSTVVDTEMKVIVGGIERRTTTHDVKQPGWDIQVRVYFKRIGGQDEYRSVDVSAFSPHKGAGS